MYNLKRDLKEGTVVWAYKNVYYDMPDKLVLGKIQMFLITGINTDYFFGSPLAIYHQQRNSTVLKKESYPLKADSAVLEYIHKLSYWDIASDKTFQVTPQTLEHFKRNLYKKIALGQASGVKEYNEEFARSYLEQHQPMVDNIIVYSNKDKQFEYYYIYQEEETSYEVLRLNRNKRDYTYSLASDELEIIPKERRFFDYYTKHSMQRPSNKEINNKVKKIGSELPNN